MALAALAFVSAFAGRPALAQSEPSAAVCEADDNEKAMHYSLYYEDFKNENYTSALPNLRWILKCAPAYAGPGRIGDRNFERAVTAYTALATKAEDPAVKHAYLDTVLVYFDTAVPVVKEAGGEVDEFSWTIDKGRFIQSNADVLPELQDQVIPIYRQAYTLDYSRMQPYYLQILLGDAGQTGQSEGLAFADELEKNYPDNAEVISLVTQARDQWLKDPSDRIAFLETRLEADPTNAELIDELLGLYIKEDRREEVYDFGQRVLATNPTPMLHRRLGQMYLADGNTSKALEHYQAAIDMSDGPANPDDYYNMGIAVREGNLQRARSLFRKALDIDPKYGRAYLGIGDLYVQQISNCGSFEREDRAVYWLAVDMYNRAKSLDPSVESAANQKINTYRKYFPTEEDKFFKGWKNGQSYSVNYGCYGWIGETTTIK